MGRKFPVCDTFVDYEGTTYLCEVWSACDGYVEDVCVSILLDGGETTPAPENIEGLPVFLEKAQEAYDSHCQEIE